MVQVFIYLMVYLGSALMVFNIIGFIRVVRFIKKSGSWGGNNGILYVPVAFLVMFLLGYLAVGIFGQPDLIVSGILFGGSIFVFLMYFFLSRIIKQVMAQEQLKTKLISTEESSKAKSAFIANMSHEMRTPMNVIIGMTDLSLKSETLSPQIRDNLNKIQHSGYYLLILINNILDLNKIEIGEMKVKNEVFSMEDTIEKMDGLIPMFCRDKGLDYISDVAEGVGGWYFGDSAMLYHVLMEIQDNAVKYTDAPGSVRFSAEVVSEQEGEKTLRFSIQDTGVGIDEEFLPKIYELFAREDESETSRFGGTGIGLTITKKKVSLMGGEISVESKKNEGSKFTVTIPFKLAEAPEEVPEEEVSLEGKRVLLAEDISENAEIVMDLLELEGVETEHAENGQIALDMFSASPEYYYDAILMDIRMPVMDGLESSRRIRALDRLDAKLIPILALTANAMDSDRRKTMEAGMNAHMAKPADAEFLYAQLRHFMTASRKHRKEDSE